MLAFYAKPYWRKEGVPLEEQATVALEPAAFNPDHPLYIDSVFDVRRLSWSRLQLAHQLAIQQAAMPRSPV